MSARKIFGLGLIIVGGCLCYVGDQRRHSLVGGIDAASIRLANHVDGAGRVAGQTWYVVGGTVLVVLGAAAFLQRGGR